MADGRSGSTCDVVCLKILLMVFNFIFWVTGIAVLALGIWMTVSMHNYVTLSEDVGFTVPYVLIGIGAAIVVFGSFACCCTVKGQPMFLYIYSGFLFIIFAAMLGAGISGYMFRDDIKDIFKKGLNESLYRYDETQHHEVTVAVDDMQISLSCCGVNNYTDWFDTPWANNTETVPKSCCFTESGHCDRGPPVNPDDINQKGCYYTVVHHAEENLVVIGSVAITIAFIQLLGSLFSCCLARAMYRSQQYQPIA